MPAVAEHLAGFARARTAGAWFSASPRVQRFAAMHVAVLLTGALGVVAMHQRPSSVEERLTLAAAAAPVQAPVVVAPEPPRQATVGATAHPASKKRPKLAPAPAPESGWAYWSGRIRGCESHGNPDAAADYKARNPHSTASGAYQITDSTWGGQYGVSHASDATPEQQDAAAADLYRRHGTTDWAASAGCWRTR
jgi:hypothetical protein